MVELNMAQLFIEESNNYQRVENIIKYIEENFQHQPELKELSEYIGLSEFHLQRLFKREQIHSKIFFHG